MEYGLIGGRLGHSFSKDIHSMIGLYEYELKSLSAEEFPSFMENADFKGINVTIPYKTDVIKYLYYIDESAKKIGAVNVIVNRASKLYGYNTDYYGLKRMIEKNGIEIRDKNVLILGTGGTSKTSYAVASDMGARSIRVAGRTPKANCITYDEAIADSKNVDVIINTTPVGMYPEINASPINIDLFENLCGVVDVIFNPNRTELVNKAQLRGIKATGGLYMLVAQAVRAAEIFTDKTLASELCDEIYKKLVERKENIVLTGMPGSGKTTLGMMLAERLGKPYYDTDALIEQKIGNIRDFITEKGEAAFRDVEKAVISELAGSVYGSVISTGGGAVLNMQNVINMRKNGKIYFLDRSIENIVPTESRPLTSDYEMLKKRYDERYGIYCSTCDVRIPNDGTAEDAINLICNDEF